MDNHALLRSAIANTKGTDEFPYTDETRIIEDLGFDSTSAMELLMELEDSSSLEIDPDTLCVEDFLTVGSFIAYLDRNIT